MGNVGTPPGTTTITLPGGLTVALHDWIDDRHWTTGELENGDVTTLQLFSAGRGQPVTGGQRSQTLVDTNIPGQGTTGLPKAWGFLVYGFAFEFMRAARPASPGAILQFQDFSDPVRFSTYFQINRRIFCEYKYNGKMYSQGLIEDYPQGHGPWVFSTQPNVEVVNNGVPSPRDRLAMILPVEEKELIGYDMNITPVIALAISQVPSDESETNLTFVDLRCTKNGLIKRQVT